jgi:hypothetical protein
MIVIKLNPGRVEEISFTGMSAAEREIEAALYPVVAPLVDRIDAVLKRTSEAVRAGLEREP